MMSMYTNQPGKQPLKPLHGNNPQDKHLAVSPSCLHCKHFDYRILLDQPSSRTGPRLMGDHQLSFA